MLLDQYLLSFLSLQAVVVVDLAAVIVGRVEVVVLAVSGLALCQFIQVLPRL